jgi:hypothetical protein
MMSEGIVTLLFFLIAEAIDYTILCNIFPRRHGLFVSIFVPAAFCLSTEIAQYFMGSSTSPLGLLIGFAHLPIIHFLVKGQFVQKLFVASFEMLAVVFQFMLAGYIAKFFQPFDSNGYWLAVCILTLAFYSVYFPLMLFFARRIFNKLLVSENDDKWLLYSGLAVFAYISMTMVNVFNSDVLRILLLVSILCSFILLCFTIISTHEKTQKRIEAEFAKNLVSSSREHYQKMNELYDKLRILRHDFKFHLNVAKNMLHSGNAEEANEYLTNAEHQLAEYEIKKYCENIILNAFITSYAERCAELNIEFSAKIEFSDSLSIPSYDMCIILGNLLENAVEANLKLKSRRSIEIATQNTDAQLLIMVKNNFDGIIRCENGVPMSLKTDGGFGLRSTREVIAHHGGNVITEWDNNTFTVYVAITIASTKIAPIKLTGKKCE